MRQRRLPQPGSTEIHIIVDDADAQNQRMKERGATSVREIGGAEYGLREVVVRDVYGFRLRFAKPI